LTAANLLAEHATSGIEIGNGHLDDLLRLFTG
jgi:hypothetical protein